MIDVNRLIGEVAARNGIRVEPGDPAFALVTLNQLVLEEAARQLTEEVRSGIAEFTVAVQKTETRAGKVLAQQVKQAAEELRQELQRDIESARLKAAEMVTEVHRAHRNFRVDPMGCGWTDLCRRPVRRRLVDRRALASVRRKCASPSAACRLLSPEISFAP